MNIIFESIINITENQGVSISDYMTDWFNSYMQGTKWENYKNQVLPMIQRIEDTYARDRGKSAIKQLAKTALAISKLSPTKPAGAPELPKNAEQQPSSPSSDVLGNLFKGQQGQRSPEQIAADAASLPKSERDKLIQRMNAVR